MEFENKVALITGTNVDAYAIAPGGKEHWDNFVKRRKEWLKSSRTDK